MVGLLILAFLLIGCILLYLLAVEIQKQQSPKRPSGKALRKNLAQSRKQFIGKSEQWHWSQATRQQPRAIKPNPTLKRWGEGGGHFPSKPTTQASKPTLQPVKTPGVTSKLPPAPLPNPLLSQPPQPQQQELTVSPQTLSTLAAAKRQQRQQQPASATVKQRLDSLTNDRKVSDRLVRRIQVSNPDRSEQWCYEKAVYDLERDRL